MNAEENETIKEPIPASNTDGNAAGNDDPMIKSESAVTSSTCDGNSGITDQNSGTNTNPDQAADTVVVKNEPSNNDSTVQVSSRTDAPVDNDDNTAKTNQTETKSMDTNEAGEVEDQDDGEDDDDDDDDDGGVKTYSGYVPISQIMWDWEPPTSLDNQTKPTTPPDTSRDQDHVDNADRDMYARKPVEGLVYTEVGEKARPTPYIWEIKARKFEKRRKNKLFVGGLVFEATKEFLYDQFEKYGELEDACIVTERGTGKSRGFGYVTFINQNEAEEAIKAIDGLRINGKTLCVEFADDPKSSPGRGPPSRGYRGRGRGRGHPSARGRYHDMDRYPDEDPYYDRGPDPYYRRGGNDTYYDRPPTRDYDRPSPRDYDRPPPPRDYDRPPPRDYDRPPPRDYDRPPPGDYDRPPPRDYDRPPTRDYDRPPPRDYDRPPPRDYYDRPPPHDPAYDRPAPRDYGDYRKPPTSYDPPAPRRETTMREVDVARLCVDREKVRREKHTSIEQQRLLARQKKKRSSSSSSSSDSSDSEAAKTKARKRHRVIPKAYMM